MCYLNGTNQVRWLAMARQRVSASDGTAHSVVQLLADTGRRDPTGRAAALLDPRPLALRLADAMDACPGTLAAVT